MPTRRGARSCFGLRRKCEKGQDAERQRERQAKCLGHAKAMGFLQPPTRLRSRRKRDHKRDRDESAIKEHDVHAHATEGKSVKGSKSNRRLATAAASTPSCLPRTVLCEDAAGLLELRRRERQPAGEEVVKRWASASARGQGRCSKRGTAERGIGQVGNAPAGRYAPRVLEAPRLLELFGVITLRE